MKHIFKLFIVSLLLLCMTAVLFAGCGSESKNNSEPENSSNTGTSDNNKATENQDKPAKKVELTLWAYPLGALEGQKPGDFYDTLAEDFNKKFNNVKVTKEIIPWEGGDQKVNVALASNSAPDMLNDYPGRTTAYAKRGYALSLNDIITEEQMAQIPKDLLEVCTLDDGTIFTYPNFLSATGLVVNKTLAEKAGAADLLPKGDGRTWTPEEFENFLMAVKGKTGDDTYPLMLYALNEQGDMIYFSFMEGFGASKFSDDRKTSTMNSKEAVQAVEYVKSLLDKGLLAPNPETRSAAHSLDYFVQGKLVVSLGNIYTVKNIEKAYEEGALKEKFEAMMVPYPSVEPGHGVFATSGGHMVAFKSGDEDREQYSKEFIKFMCSEHPDTAKAFSAVDVFGRNDHFNTAHPEEQWLSKILLDENISSIDPSYDINGYSEIRAKFYPEIQAVFIGKKSPQQAMDDFVKEANEIIEKNTKE